MRQSNRVDLIVSRTTLAMNNFDIVTPSALRFKTPSAPQLPPLAAKKPWMAEDHDTFVEHLYLSGRELRRKKRAEESSEDADTSKRVRYNSESEDDHPARDRRTL